MSRAPKTRNNPPLAYIPRIRNSHRYDEDITLSAKDPALLLLSPTGGLLALLIVGPAHLIFTAGDISSEEKRRTSDGKVVFVRGGIFKAGKEVTGFILKGGYKAFVGEPTQGIVDALTPKGYFSQQVRDEERREAYTGSTYSEGYINKKREYSDSPSAGPSHQNSSAAAQEPTSYADRVKRRRSEKEETQIQGVF